MRMRFFAGLGAAALSGVVALFAAGCGKTVEPAGTSDREVDKNAEKYAPVAKEAVKQAYQREEKISEVPAINERDMAVQGAIKRALQEDPTVQFLELTVNARNGVVTLTGQAQTAEQVEKALAIARGMAGPYEVRSQIELKK
jgi:osmotically-inducible protein OsmY